ncbi:MAG: carbohydrate porin [Nostoc indistinguendum CM1-VF10]|nr:carbohydrate porin [Nostoc indistinguendum CM1-VF10]
MVRPQSLRNGAQIVNNIIFSDRVQLIFNTSFTGQDLLRVRFQAGNIPNFREATGTNMARLSFDAIAPWSITI